MKEEPDTRNDNVEYVSEQLDVGPALEAFSDVFARFQFSLDSNTVRLVFPISSALSSFLSHLTRTSLPLRLNRSNRKTSPPKAK